MKQKLIVVKKPLTYATRRMQAGDGFEASSRDARVLIALKRAKALKAPREPGALPPPPATLMQAVKAAPASVPVSDDIAALRDEYIKIVGKRPFHGWGADELRTRISAANV